MFLLRITEDLRVRPIIVATQYTSVSPYRRRAALTNPQHALTYYCNSLKMYYITHIIYIYMYDRMQKQHKYGVE
jgi:hypothetical protein